MFFPGIFDAAQQREKILSYAGLASLNNGGGNADFHAAFPSNDDSSFAIRNTLRTLGCVPTNSSFTPCCNAFFLARIISPTPALSMNCNEERSIWISLFGRAVALM